LTQCAEISGLREQSLESEAGHHREAGVTGISVKEFRPGVLQITIAVARYGDAGAHWKRTLSGAMNGGYGKIYIQREGRKQRQYWHTVGPRMYYRAEKGVNQDECPGAMFIWTSRKEHSVEAVDAIHNQNLGRDLKNSLLPYQQQTPNDLWEVTFLFA
jgi:hypothetical protein